MSFPPPGANPIIQRTGRDEVAPTSIIKHLHCQSALNCTIGGIWLFRAVSKLQGATMMDALLLVLVTGAVLLALGVDLGVVIGWLRNRNR